MYVYAHTHTFSIHTCMFGCAGSRRRVTVASYEPEYMDAKAPPSDNNAYAYAYGPNAAYASTPAPPASNRHSWSGYVPRPIECPLALGTTSGCVAGDAVANSASRQDSVAVLA